MSDMLDLLQDFVALQKKYKVVELDDEPAFPSPSPYWVSGGVSTMGMYPLERPQSLPPKITYGYERYTWKDSVEDDN